MRRRRLASLVAAAALATGAVAGCGGERGARYPGAPIVLISIDTLRADRLPIYGYRGVETPAIDALAADGVVFDNAYSHYPLTLPAHTSLLTGQLPPRHGVRDNAGYPFHAESHPYLPRLLGGAGYATGGFVSTYVLRADTGLGAGFATYDSAIEIEPGASLDSGQRPGLQTTALAAQWIREQGERPFFAFLHLYEPHTPYTPPEPFRSRYAAEPYDGEIATADTVVGGLMHELKRLGLYDRALIALVADHGEGLGDHGEDQHGVFLYRSTLHVPLLLKLPRRERAGERVARPVGLVDLAPTLLAAAGVALPDDLDGRSLLAAPDAGEPARGIYAESYYPRLHFGWSDLQALYEERWAYVDAPEAELFDLAADPAQQRNVLAANRREYSRLRDAVAAIDRPLADPESVDAETAAKLAALGYLSAAPVRGTGELPDPKSQRGLLASIESGFTAFSTQRYEEAVGHFRTTLAANDQMLDVWAFLARALHQLGREEESVAAWERVLELSGGSSDVALLVATGQFRLKRYAEARELAELGQKGNPQAADELLAQIDLAEGKRGEAFERMERAVREGRATEGIAYKLALARLEAGAPGEAAALLAPFAAEAEAATRVVYGLALSDSGRHADGLGQLEQARAQGDDSAKLHEALGTVLLRLERAAEARAALERALAIDARRPDAWNTLGVALYRLEGPRPAIDAWKRALALDPERYDVLYNLGLVALQAGDRAEARRALGRFVERAPRDRYAQDILRAQAAALFGRARAAASATASASSLRLISSSRSTWR
ncbi:MAG: sulfatase-like hydrolase/transferase [Thermoanaerobaculia bacterium]|nr:sulfatase-like hydrolase/transferase [Thermoanaerobaculia bacterium]